MPTVPAGGHGRPIPKGAEFSAGILVGGSYEIVDYLGRGAMGFVYRARHNVLGREYALKTLGAEQVSETSWRRFQIEAQAIAKMSHPNVVGIHNFALHQSEGNPPIPFYVMDLLEGSNLGERLEEHGSPPLAILLSIFQQAAAGIGYAHSKGMIHRDVKPGNIVLLNSPDAVGATVKIVDFGIAKLTDSEYGAQKLTTAGEVFGSPLYMSPEQSMAQTLDARTDIYSLGVTLYEALTCEPPFIAGSAVEVMMMHQSAPVPIINEVSQVGYPPEIQQIVEMMLAKMPEDRYQSMDHVIHDLTAIARGQEPTFGTHTSTNISRVDGLSSATTHANTLNRVEDQAVEEVLDASSPLYGEASFEQEPEEEPEEKSARTIKALSVGFAAVAILASLALFLVSRAPDSVKVDQKSTDELTLGTISAEVGVTVFKKGGTDYTGLEKELTKPEGVAEKPANPDRADFDSTMEMSKNRFGSYGGELKPPSGSQNDTFMFSTIEKVDGVKIRRFKFPTDITLGRFEAGKNDLDLEAKGLIDLSLAVKYTFVPYRSTENYPQYFKRFRPGDIVRVAMWPGVCRDKVLEGIANIPGLEYLNIASDDGFTAASVSNSLHKIKTLQSFKLKESKISGATLAAANCWQKLVKLDLNGVFGVEPLLKELRGSPGLKGLTLQNCKLKGRDFVLISTLSSLRGLDVAQNKLTAKDLSVLSKLPLLGYLNLKGCGLDGAALEELRKFPSLRELNLKVGEATKKKGATLLKPLKGVLVHQ
ncbi:hypothetical protein BH11CYA1_BH11CYA1_12970 [soil metagenome]